MLCRERCDVYLATSVGQPVQSPRARNRTYDLQPSPRGPGIEHMIFSPVPDRNGTYDLQQTSRDALTTMLRETRGELSCVLLGSAKRDVW